MSKSGTFIFNVLAESVKHDEEIMKILYEEYDKRAKNANFVEQELFR